MANINKIKQGNQKDNGSGSEPVIGIDFGETNVGVALGRNGFVTPLSIFSHSEVAYITRELARLAIENKISTFVIGLPLDEHGKDTPEAVKVRHFAKLLKSVSKKRVIFQNEFNSSVEAFSEAISKGLSMKSRKKTDHLSAALILKRYFDEQS